MHGRAHKTVIPGSSGEEVPGSIPPGVTTHKASRRRLGDHAAAEAWELVGLYSSPDPRCGGQDGPGASRGLTGGEGAKAHEPGDYSFVGISASASTNWTSSRELVQLVDALAFMAIDQ